VSSGMIINAAGPMVDDMNEANGIETNSRIVFSKGVHLIVPQLTELTKIMTFFANDGRLFFAIPMGTRTCIGTTDTAQEHWASEVTGDDVQFILDNINAQMALPQPLTKEDVIATRCGVRPLAVKKGVKHQGDWMKLSRKHVNEINGEKKYVSIYGGKLTDCVNVGNELRAICRLFGFSLKGQHWYGEDEGKEAFLAQAKHLNKECLDGIDSSAERLWRRYGKEAGVLLAMINDQPDLAEEAIAGSGVLRAEVSYAAEHEMVVTMEDFLRRRTNLSLCHRVSAAKEEMMQMAKMLFGDEAVERLREYQQAQANPNESY